MLTQVVQALREEMAQGMQAIREEVRQDRQKLREEAKLENETNKNLLKHLQKHLQVAEELRSDTTTYLGSVHGSVTGPESDRFCEGSIRGLKSGEVSRIMRWNDSGRFSSKSK